MNPQTLMHVVATDVDELAAMMAYIQFTLLHIPAFVVHGNTLTAETFQVWPTLAHATGLWDYKLRRHYALKADENKNLPKTEKSRDKPLSKPPTHFDTVKQLRLF